VGCGSYFSDERIASDDHLPICALRASDSGGKAMETKGRLEWLLPWKRGRLEDWEGRVREQKEERGHEEERKEDDKAGVSTK